MDISLALYVEDTTSLATAQRNVGLYSRFFNQIFVLINSFIPHPINFGFTTKEVNIIDFKGKISQGACFNKLLSHSSSKRVLLLDASTSFDKLMISNLYSIANQTESSYLVGFSPCRKLPDFFPKDRINGQLSKQLSLVKNIAYGGLLFDPFFINSIGGFEDRLNNDSLFLDLSMRTQKTEGLVLESDLKFSLLNKTLEASSLNEKVYISQKYPENPSDFFTKILSMYKKNSFLERSFEKKIH